MRFQCYASQRNTSYYIRGQKKGHFVNLKSIPHAETIEKFNLFVSIFGH